jgi:hypothetical protein
MTHRFDNFEGDEPQRLTPRQHLVVGAIIGAFLALLIAVILWPSPARAMPVPAGEMSRSAIAPMPSIGEMGTASLQTSSNLAGLPAQILARLSQDPAATLGSLAQLGLLPPAQPAPVGQGNGYVPFGERDSVRIVCEGGDAILQLAAVAPRDGQYRVTVTPIGSPAGTQVLLDKQLRSGEQVLLVTPVPQGAEVIVGLAMPASADAQFSGEARYTAPRCR